MILLLDELDCVELADLIKEDTKKKLGGANCILAVASQGDMTAADEMYLRGVRKDAEGLGISVARDSLSDADGILYLGNSWSSIKRAYKDVDGISDGLPYSMSVVEAVELMAKSELTCMDGMNALVIGRGKVGRQVADMLIRNNATVSVAHTYTQETILRWLARRSDIIVIAGATGLDLVSYAPENGRTLVIDLTGGNVIRAEGFGTVKVAKGIGKVTRAVLLKRVVENFDRGHRT